MRYWRRASQRRAARHRDRGPASRRRPGQSPNRLRPQTTYLQPIRVNFLGNRLTVLVDLLRPRDGDLSSSNGSPSARPWSEIRLPHSRTSTASYLWPSFSFAPSYLHQSGAAGQSASNRPRFPVQDRHLAAGAWHGHPAHDSPRPPPWKPVPPARSFHDATTVPNRIGTVPFGRRTRWTAQGDSPVFSVRPAQHWAEYHSGGWEVLTRPRP